jgi:hypothetical protein
MYSLARVFFGFMLAAGAAALGFRQMASIIARGAGRVVKCGQAEDKKCLWFLVKEFTKFGSRGNSAFATSSMGT